MNREEVLYWSFGSSDHFISRQAPAKIFGKGGGRLEPQYLPVFLKSTGYLVIFRYVEDFLERGCSVGV